MSSVFFFSSRRRHTRLVSDWSSDVCSSDLGAAAEASESVAMETAARPETKVDQTAGSEERRVGKECRSRWSPYHEKKKRLHGVKAHKRALLLHNQKEGGAEGAGDVRQRAGHVGGQFFFFFKQKTAYEFGQ